MRVQLYTSLTGLDNYVLGKGVFAFTAGSPMRSEIDNVLIWVDAEDIHKVSHNGIITIKPASGHE